MPTTSPRPTLPSATGTGTTTKKGTQKPTAAGTLFLVLGLGLCALGGASKRTPPLAIRFHAEANARDTDTFAMPVNLGGDPPRQVFVERVPSISERDFVAVFPFPARGGGSYGAEFQLSEHGRLTLQTVSAAHRGGFLLAMVNGRPLLPLTVDRVVTDGLLVVPYGLTAGEVRTLEETYPHVGQPPGSRPARKSGAN